jgi:hypothetical protein
MIIMAVTLQASQPKTFSFCKNIIWTAIENRIVTITMFKINVDLS